MNQSVRLAYMYMFGCGLVLMGLLGCCATPNCDLDAWEMKGTNMVTDGPYFLVEAKFDPPRGMTEDRMRYCIRHYLLKNIGKNNEITELPFKDDFKGGMRKVDFWAFAYADLVDHKFMVPCWAEWEERDKLILELLKQK